MNGQLSTLFRSFAVQAAFSYERMSGLGLSFIMRPLLHNLPGEKREAAGERSARSIGVNATADSVAETAKLKTVTATAPRLEFRMDVTCFGLGLGYHAMANRIPTPSLASAFLGPRITRSSTTCTVNQQDEAHRTIELWGLLWGI